MEIGVAKAAMPGFKVGNTSGIQSRRGGRQGGNRRKMGDSRDKAYQGIEAAVGCNVTASKNRTRLISDPTRVGVKMRDIVALTIESNNGDEAHRRGRDKKYILELNQVPRGHNKFNGAKTDSIYTGAAEAFHRVRWDRS